MLRSEMFGIIVGNVCPFKFTNINYLQKPIIRKSINCCNFIKITQQGVYDDVHPYRCLYVSGPDN